MWEFALTMESQKADVAKFIYNSIKPKIDEVGGIVTSFEEKGKISIVLACEDFEKNRVGYHLRDVITCVICSYMKEDFLNKNLKFPPKSLLELHTFKKALVSFDRETDRFIVNKNLNLQNNLVLESFFYFKLQSLKEKWQELVKIANDNSTYFLNDDSFIELLRFLIENIEVSFDEVNVICKDSGIVLLNSEFEKLPHFNNEVCDEFELVSRLLQLSPRKINWYASKHNFFLEKVFEKRIFFVQKEDNFKNILDNSIKLM